MQLSRTAPEDPLAGSLMSMAQLPTTSSVEGRRQTHRMRELPGSSTAHSMITRTCSQISKRGRPADWPMYRTGCSSPPAAAAPVWPRALSAPPMRVRRQSPAGFLMPVLQRRFEAPSLQTLQGFESAHYQKIRCLQRREGTHSVPLRCIASAPMRPWPMNVAEGF